MSIFNDFEHRGYEVKYHSSRGMLQVIWYEVFAPDGEKLGEANSSEEAKAMIDQVLDGKQ